MITLQQSRIWGWGLSLVVKPELSLSSQVNHSLLWKFKFGEKYSACTLHFRALLCYSFRRKLFTSLGFPGSSVSKESSLQCRIPGFDPWVGKIVWRRKWQTTAVFLPGEFHGQRSLVGYSPWGHKSQTQLSDPTTHHHSPPPSCSGTSNSLRSHKLQHTRLFFPWDFSGTNTEVGCHFFLQGIVLTQGYNQCLLHLLHFR